MTTKQFEVPILDKPGEVARLAEVLAKNAVNIRGISTDLGKSPPIIHVITDDEASARRVLKAGGFDFVEKEVLVISMSDKPGELAKITRKLAKAGINIESMFILGPKASEVQVAVGVDQRKRAQDLLAK
ncbi:MAG TPA: ACT domain-containing protein [Methanomassiliicoccales archaeon]|nr:ACT domain-containing protein [Methanomassiliicoccales archaeon]